MKRLLIVILALSSLTMLWGGCGDDDKSTGSANPSMPEELVGQWFWVYAELNDQPTPYSELNFTDIGTGQIIVFEADGGWQMYELSGNDTVYTQGGLCYDEGDSLRMTTTFEQGGAIDDPVSRRIAWELLTGDFDLRIGQRAVVLDDVLLMDVFYDRYYPRTR